MALESNISPRIIKVISEIIGDLFIDAIDKHFPTALKQANITPVFKKGERYSKNNYRTMSILPYLSKKFLKKECFVKCLLYR